jgi:hypothetical protein
MDEVASIRLSLVRQELSDKWRTTPEIARALGIEWTPGSHGDLDEVRADLYRLQLRGEAEIDVTARPLRWRLSIEGVTGVG